MSDTIAELRELRRGRGLLADDISFRVGPNIRSACGILETDGPTTVRRKLIVNLTYYCARLPTDLRLAVLVALAIYDSADQRFLHERMAWLGAHYKRDPRTARRRIDEGFRALAAKLIDSSNRPQGPSQNRFAPDGWYVESMKGTLRLDTDPPRLLEERRIVATVEELDEIVSSMSAHGTPNQDGSATGRIEAQVLHGAEIVEEWRPSQGTARYVLRLPRPLRLGERHDFAIEFVANPRDHMLPYYAVTPLRRYDQIRIQLRFGSAFRPSLLWKLNGVPPRVVDDFAPGEDLLTVNPVGDVQVEFIDVRQGLSYGIQWIRA